MVVFRTKVLPTGQRFYSLYINPQVEKIREKIFEYKVMKERVESVKVVEKKEKVIAEELGVDDLDGSFPTLSLCAREFANISFWCGKRLYCRTS